MRGLFAFLLFVCVAMAADACVYHRCASPASPFYIQDQVHAASFPAKPAWVTPKNVAVDPSSLPINPGRVDRLVDEVEACLMATFPGGDLPPDVVVAGGCRAPHVPLPFPRSCMTIKVIRNWFLSTYEFAGSKQQLIPGWVATGCTEKGLPPGPCYRRSGIINGDTIVVTPSLYLLKDSLVELYAGCTSPWSSPPLAACVTPTTGPLDDGSGP